MVKLDSEDLGYLKTLDTKLRSAHFQSYVRGAQKADSRKLRDMLKKYNQPTTEYNNLGCGKCILKLYKQVAIIYLNNIGENVT